MYSTQYKYVIPTPSGLEDFYYMSNGQHNILVHADQIKEYLSKGYIKGYCKPYLF